MIYFGNPFKLPGPKDLGMSDSNNAMPMRDFSDTDEPTWEDFYARLKQDYPVRFFLSSTLPDTLLYAWRRTLGWKLRDGWYWLKSRVWRKDHIIDLRQPGKDQLEADYYRWGWLETDTKMLFALFTLLDEFMKNGLPLYLPTPEQAEKDDGKDYEHAGMKKQREVCFELLTIHEWWKRGRKVNCQIESDLCSKWSDAKRARSPETASLWQELLAKTAKNEQDEEEMIARLLKIRKCLWT
jgi:hypothetical protein